MIDKSLRIWRSAGIALAFLGSCLSIVAISTAIASCVGCSVARAPASAVDAERDVLAQAALGTVRVVVLGTDEDGDQAFATGSGSVVWHAGSVANVLTAAHVVGRLKKVDRILVDTILGDKAEARVEALDARRDLALLLVAGNLRVRNVPLARGDEVLLSRVFVMGFPMGQFALSEGFYAGKHAMPEKGGLVTVVVTGGFVFPGNSGGSLLDRRGRLLGVIVSCALAGPEDAPRPVPELGSAVKVSDVRAFLAASGVPFEERP